MAENLETRIPLGNETEAYLRVPEEITQSQYDKLFVPGIRYALRLIQKQIRGEFTENMTVGDVTQIMDDDKLADAIKHGYPVIAPDARCVTMTRDKSGKLVFGRSLPYDQDNNASKNRK